MIRTGIETIICLSPNFLYVYVYVYEIISWRGGQGHALLIFRSQLRDLPPGTRFQFTPRTQLRTQRSVDNLKYTCLLFLTELQY